MTKEQIKTSKLNEERNNLVVQSNTLIRNISAIKEDLTVSEQKLIIYLISKICADDIRLNKVSMTISEYCDICGINKSGAHYNRVKSSLRALRNKSWWLKSEHYEMLFSWIDIVEINKNGNIEIMLSQGLSPFLLELNKNFTKYELINVLCLRSKYSIRLYEILKSYLWLKEWTIQIDEFRELLYLQNKYNNYKELNRTVISPSIKEINKFTDLNVSIETIKYGNKVDKLVFKIDEKEGVQMVLDLIHNQDERLKD